MLFLNFSHNKQNNWGQSKISRVTIKQGGINENSYGINIA